LPIFIGGAIKGLVDKFNKKEGKEHSAEEEDLGKGNLFATGLVAGGALAGVLVAILFVNENIAKFIETKLSIEHWLTNLFGGETGYFLWGTLLFLVMAVVLFFIGIKKNKEE
jgi:hypothetical protein